MLNHASGGLRLAIPLYDTLHTVGEAMGPWACALGDVWGQLGRAASNRQPMSVPLNSMVQGWSECTGVRARYE